MANLPNGRRVLAKALIGGKNYYCRVKEGTATILNLPLADSLPVGPDGGIIRGAKGTKSYTVYFKTPQPVGGATVKSVDLPVPDDVKLRPMYNFLKNKPIVAGMRTPWGISYFWSKTQGGIQLPDIPEIVENIQDFIQSPGVQLTLDLIDLII